MTKGALRNILVNYGLTNDEYNKIRGKIVETNIKNMTIASIVFSIYSFAFLVYHLIKIAYGTVSIGKIIAYLVSFVTSFVMFILTRLVSKKHDKALKYFIYFFIVDIVALGILVDTVLDPSHLSVTFIALMILAPLIFSDRPYRIIPTVMVGVLIFCLTAYFTKDDGIWQQDILNVSIFSVISTTISIYLGKVKINGYWNAYQASLLANSDLLTGLNNRNCYEVNVNRYLDRIKSNITCFYIDANELHVINNKYGHEYGDEMLVKIANILVSLFNYDDVYRIGGDEFICFAIDRNLNEIMALTKTIQLKISQMGYHVACGASTHEKATLDMKELIKETESIMYEDKKKYYADQAKEVRNNYQNE